MRVTVVLASGMTLLGLMHTYGERGTGCGRSVET